jgi:hypothetical protein
MAGLLTLVCLCLYRVDVADGEMADLFGLREWFLAQTAQAPSLVNFIAAVLFREARKPMSLLKLRSFRPASAFTESRQ